MLSVFDVPESDAALRSGVLGAAVTMGAAMVSDTPVEVVALPAASVAIAVSVRDPAVRFDEGVNVQLPDPFAVAVPMVVDPSRIAMLAFASAVPEMVGAKLVVDDPSSGDVMTALGPVVSTVTTNAGDAAETLPTLSVEVVVNEWAPEARVAVVNDQFPLAFALTVPIRAAPS